MVGSEQANDLHSLQTTLLLVVGSLSLPWHLVGMKRVVRDPEDKFVSGLCAGIGRTYGLDPTMVRLIVFFVTLMTGLLPGFFTYILTWMITPSSDTLL